MKKIASALILCASISAPVLAADAGGYVNLDLGKASFSNAQSQYSAASFSGPNAYSIGGGYRYNQNLAVEADYTVNGDSTINTIGLGTSHVETLKTSSFQLAAVGNLPINEQFSLFAKLGMANTKVEYSDMRATFGSPAVTNTVSASKTNLMFGIGAQLNVNQNWGIRLQYIDLGKVQLPQLAGGATAPNVGVKVTSVGVAYKF